MLIETELPSPVESPSHLVPDFETDEPIKPYEKRALNHLVNEYLLVNDNKLTSVTFAEENENQVIVLIKDSFSVKIIDT